MKDIDIAKELLHSQKFAIVIVKEGEVIFSSRDRGIKPMYTAVNEILDQLKGASIADRVIGKAAAMLCVHAGIEELYTKLISENAIKALEGTSIKYKYDETTPYIKNRDKTGMCPVETLSQKVDTTNTLLEEISKFLESIKERG